MFFRRDRGATLYVTDTPVVDLPEKGNNLGHSASFLPHCLAMHLEKQRRLIQLQRIARPSERFDFPPSISILMKSGAGRLACGISSSSVTMEISSTTVPTPDRNNSSTVFPSTLAPPAMSGFPTILRVS